MNKRAMKKVKEAKKYILETFKEEVSLKELKIIYKRLSRNERTKTKLIYNFFGV